MTAQAGAEDHTPTAQEVVRLRGEGARVVRLSRKAIGAASAVAIGLVGGALLYALQPTRRAPGAAPVNTNGVAMADALVDAPRDYSQIPKLGPPLPGDLGKPILAARNRGAVAALPPIAAGSRSRDPALDPKAAMRQRTMQDRLAARASQLFVARSRFEDEGDTVRSDTAGAAPSTDSAAGSNANAANRKVGPNKGLTDPPAMSVLQAGSVIAAALITGIRSDQPGLVTAQVTQNVYDSLTGQHLLIPQGARLIGAYASNIGAGQRRVQLSWQRLILPDGRSMVLDRLMASDPAGYAGLQDRVNFHWAGVFKAALISTILGVGGELGQGNASDLGRALRYGMQDSVNRTGEKIVSRQLDIQPTLTIRPGFPISVLVSHDLVFNGDP